MDSGGGFGWTGRKSSAIGNQMNVYIVIETSSGVSCSGTGNL